MAILVKKIRENHSKVIIIFLTAHFELEYDLYAAMLNLVGSGEKTPEEAAQWIMEKLEEYTRRQLELAPFYDAEYSNSLRLGSMQVH